MAETKIPAHKLSNFGRAFSLLYNRSTMYDADHPYSKQAVDDFLPIVEDILSTHSPLVFIMNQEQFFIDEEPLDPRINTSKLVAHFKKGEILSISFYKGVKKQEIRAFLKIFTMLNKHPNADAMKKALKSKHIQNIRINHVFFKKVSSDEEIVSREAYKKISDVDDDGLQVSSKKMFMDMVLESLLTEEFEKALTIKNITENPAEVSKNMIDTDINTYNQSNAEDKSPGPVLMHQLQMLGNEVEKHVSGMAQVKGAVGGIGPGAGFGNAVIGGGGAEPGGGGSGGAGLGTGTGSGTGPGTGEGGEGPGGGGSGGTGLGTGTGSGTGPGTGEGGEGPGGGGSGSTGLGTGTGSGTGTGKAGYGSGTGRLGFGAGGVVGTGTGMGAGKAGYGGDGDGHAAGTAGTGTGLGEGGGDGKGGSAELSELAAAVFDMKRQLISGIERQKSLGTTYSNEEEILDKANEITDNVLIQLIKEEYKSGQISTSRLAHILKRLVPDVKELKRLMPKIKAALLEEGMPLAEYLDLVQELSTELESEELSKILKESAEKSGLDGDELVEEVKSNPVQAAELIYLAAEIRKGSSDDNELTDVLVNYVEQVGSKLAMDIAEKDNVKGEENLQKVVSSVESEIIGRLRNMDVKNDVLDRLEEKLTGRMDELFETFKEEYAATRENKTEEEQKDRSILEILEEGVNEDDELGKILSMVRSEAEEKGIDQNDFKEIFSEINKIKQSEREKKLGRKKPVGVLNSEQLMFFLEKEISRSKRYDLPFATMSFSVVSAKPKTKAPPGVITQQALIDVILHKLASEIRGADVAALLEENKIVALLPMTPPDEATLALRRHVKLLNTEKFEIKGIPVSVQVAGVATNFDDEQTPDAEAFIEKLNGALSEMVLRIKNLHGLT